MAEVKWGVAKGEGARGEGEVAGLWLLLAKGGKVRLSVVPSTAGPSAAEEEQVWQLRSLCGCRIIDSCRVAAEVA